MGLGSDPASPRRLVALALLALLPACGGDDGPTSPSLAAPEPTWVTTPGLASVTYAFSWPAQPGATSYLVEIGSSVGASDVLSQEVTAPALTTSPLPANPGIQDYFLRFRSRGPSGESDVKATFAPVVDLRTVVEALFFESGPRRPPFAAADSDVIDRNTGRFSAFGAADVMLGWQPGSRVTVIASTALRDQQMQAARDTVDQFNLAAGGVVRAVLTTTTDPTPRPRPGAITLAPGDPVAECGGNAIGCAVRTIEGGEILQAELIVTANSSGCVTAHELGHGLHGFGHIILANVPGIVDATMSPGGCQVSHMTEPENDALQESYARGMRAGARRQDFVRAGLIVP